MLADLELPSVEERWFSECCLDQQFQSHKEMFQGLQGSVTIPIAQEAEPRVSWSPFLGYEEFTKDFQSGKQGPEHRLKAHKGIDSGLHGVSLPASPSDSSTAQ